jgi:hypothetical protein
MDPLLDVEPEHPTQRAIQSFGWNSRLIRLPQASNQNKAQFGNGPQAAARSDIFLDTQVRGAKMLLPASAISMRVAAVCIYPPVFTLLS